MNTKQRIVSAFRRAEILDAARSVFARKGFSRGIVDAIAKEAGMAKGTIYLYFRSKREIYRAVLNHDMESLKKDTLSRIDAATDLREKIRAFILARIEGAEARKEFFRIMDIESGGVAMTRSQYRDSLREPVMRLAAAIESELPGADSEKVAWLIADMTRGTIQRRLLGPADSLPGEDAEFLVGFICAALALR